MSEIVQKFLEGTSFNKSCDSAIQIDRISYKKIKRFPGVRSTLYSLHKRDCMIYICLIFPKITLKHAVTFFFSKFMNWFFLVLGLSHPVAKSSQAIVENGAEDGVIDGCRIGGEEGANVVVVVVVLN